MLNKITDLSDDILEMVFNNLYNIRFNKVMKNINNEDKKQYYNNTEQINYFIPFTKHKYFDFDLQNIENIYRLMNNLKKNWNLASKYYYFDRKKIIIDEENWSWYKYINDLEVNLNNDEFNELWDCHPQNFDTLKIFGKNVPLPRYQQAYGKNYKFNNKIHKAEPFNDIIKKILDYVNKLDELDNIFNKNHKKYNTCFINWYEDGNHYIGHHSDDEKELVENSNIYCFSFGAERDFILKHKQTKQNIKINLQNNSLIIMGDCQKTHTHSLPIRKKVKDKRISITFRKFK
tara:strand:- start:233 stop:1099 length:867 start_codon:yes stop_codon:yes gene_type:complete